MFGVFHQMEGPKPSGNREASQTFTSTFINHFFYSYFLFRPPTPTTATFVPSTLLLHLNHQLYQPISPQNSPNSTLPTRFSRRLSQRLSRRRALERARVLKSTWSSWRRICQRLRLIIRKRGLRKSFGYELWKSMIMVFSMPMR